MQPFEGQGQIKTLRSKLEGQGQSRVPLSVKIFFSEMSICLL